jgi:hypothetical protein
MNANLIIAREPVSHRDVEMEIASRRRLFESKMEIFHHILCNNTRQFPITIVITCGSHCFKEGASCPRRVRLDNSVMASPSEIAQIMGEIVDELNDDASKRDSNLLEWKFSSMARCPVSAGDCTYEERSYCITKREL